MAQLEPVTDSFYDFIYIDDHKSKILLAQLETNGILTQIKSKISDEESSLSEAGLSKFIVAKKNKSISESGSTEHSFDTSFSNHLSLLHTISEQDRIKKDISTANIGDIVLFSGLVNILDISTLQKLAPVISLFQSQKGKSKSAKGVDTETKLITEILKILPSSVQFTFQDNKDSSKKAWMTTSDANMLISSSDLLLKYGNSLGGSWSVIGILDSKPNNEQNVLFDDRDICLGLNEFSSALKGLIGKKDTDYGITPLMIFRKVN